MGFSSIFGHVNLGVYVCTQVLSPLQSIELGEPAEFPVHSNGKIRISAGQLSRLFLSLSLFPRSSIFLKLFIKPFIFLVTHLKLEYSIPVVVTEPQ